MKLFSTLAVKKALEDVILEAFEQETGIEVQTVFDPTNQLLRRIQDGEKFDVMIGVTDSFAALDDIIDARTLTAVARTGVGVAVPPGTPTPDISSPESFVQTLLQARSVAYSRTGASGIYFTALLNKLGIAEKIGPRATVLEKGFVAEAIVDGRADLAVQQLSELLFVPQAHIAGPFPPELQHYTEFSAAVSAEPGERSEAETFVRFLTSPQATAAYIQTMLELPVTHTN
ncbi:extracellular solute-binding protein [Pseudarthrobacter sp. NamE5]|uniref:substrate-binding domain-containing protein n=1 Tax=Pseudarthrobacter sp. NamE5 TaxID=2576839 RepID=UPI00110B4B17|nr:substrate-binding domain-containing protein [Pseudarthrobacter sp. NamE5]TLM80901.1 ABC transporter substrate-binding protein [Pseudarthrobacter sp. NamE5]